MLCEKAVFSYENAPVSYEITTVSYEMIPVSYEMKTVSYEMITVSHETTTVSYEMITVSYETTTVSYEMFDVSHKTSRLLLNSVIQQSTKKRPVVTGRMSFPTILEKDYAMWKLAKTFTG